ncbi:MAG TPA: serine hydrolase [Anaeromyxobacter sp.]|nr:serine hydrolase [Anaeromyxobacter sp.]
MRRRALVAAALLGLAPAASRAADRCPAGARAPAGDWPSAAAEVRSARAAAVAALDAYAFTLDGDDAARRGIRTDGLVVVHRGVVTYERYGRGFGPSTPHLAWSVAKTVTQALTGAAVARGALSLDDSICAHRAGVEAARCAITVRSLLASASGLEWTEGYEGLALQTSSVLAMLYGEGRRDMAGFALAHALRAPPGTRWNYSSGDAVLLAATADAAMRRAGAGPDWPFEVLFAPLGMTSATFERDAAGTIVGSSWFYATPRDLARLGWLLLQDGCWQGRPLLPAGWVREATQVNAAYRTPGGARRARDGAYGWDLWLNRPVREVGLATPWPGAPEDAYAARGHWGQNVVVIPSQELVIVRTADDRDTSFDLGRLVALAIAAGRLP